MSATTYETVVVAGDFITIDLLVWRRFKRRTDGLVDRILMSNPELAVAGPYLPVGTVVKIPIDAPASGAVRVEAIRLWN
ncbi:tail protein X [Kaistia sp. UC242_56]|uniref:tail protein X n=1 Tax=Kaistia sp. UC242_56 TaxID=3374625 RepID=UPI0037A07DDF